MKGSITVIIPTRSRIQALQAVWPSYLRQSNVARIVIVDDGSTDATRATIEDWASRGTAPLDVIYHPRRRGHPAARLTGIGAAKTEWVLFGEDDVWLSADYCSTLLREAEELGASIIAGRIVTARVPEEFSEERLTDPPTALRDATSLFDLRSMEADFSARVAKPVRAPFLHSIALIRRDLFERVSFDPWYSGNAWREETDFYLAANSTGASVYFSPNAVCFHLRGPISASGGHRINRVRFEYLAWRNTRYLVSKHWQYLKDSHGLRGSVNRWMLQYYVRRQLAQLRRLARHGARSTYRG